jgi:hypothetical protein
MMVVRSKWKEISCNAVLVKQETHEKWPEGRVMRHEHAMLERLRCGALFAASSV